MRYKGATLSSTAPVTTGGESGTAPGAWTLEQQAQAQAAGLWPIPPQPKYVEDVFSTWLYNGNGTTQTIINGIDLSTYGGLVWQKNRTQALNNRVTDTVRGATKTLITDSITDQQNYAGGLTSFNSNGFSIGTDGPGNNAGDTFASWTFRKQSKFFDIQEWTGNATNRTISHNLGSVPACIMVKRRDASGAWQVYHRSLANTEYLVLNTTAAVATNANRWNSTTPTSTEFSLGTDVTVNASGGSYVAYLFAHDAGGFGLSGTDNVISCGSYTGNGSIPAPTVTLGYEPQWVLIKATNASDTYYGNWAIFDSMRGIITSPTADPRNAQIPDPYLRPNTLGAEDTATQVIRTTATGFQIESDSSSAYNEPGTTYIYIAIRRGPMKVPTLGTSVFSPNLAAAQGQLTTGFPVDLGMWNYRTGYSENTVVNDRLRGVSSTNAVTNANNLITSSTVAEQPSQGTQNWNNTGLYAVTGDAVFYSFRRAPSFFDEICFDEATAPVSALPHNLTVVPELVIYKKRSGTSNWITFSNVDLNKYLRINTDNALTAGLNWSATSSTVNLSATTGSGTAVAYLFATCAGVSKVGSYTGTGAAQTINCGFTAGARFVLIKRTDSTGDWYVWDSARGIVSGNDPYLLLNSTAAEVTGTDYVDTAATGFEISSTAPAAINANGGSFVFLAIA
jgi:hypothetical protein